MLLRLLMASCRIRQSRDAFVAMLDENVDRGLVRLSHAKEFLGDDPRWRVRHTTHAVRTQCVWVCWVILDEMPSQWRSWQLRLSWLQTCQLCRAL